MRIRSDCVQPIARLPQSQHTLIGRLARCVARGLAMLWLVLPAVHAQQALQVFTCEPEWAALIKALHPSVKVFSATHAGQDPHDIEARPALISALRRADFAVCTGAGLEAGWLPTLQQRAGNPRVMPGRPGMIFAADGLSLIADAHHHTARDKGHVHAEGNPHFHLDPRRLIPVAERISEHLARADPAHAREYRTRLESWRNDWTQQIERWQQQAKPLFGLAVIAEHSSFAYLFRWLDLYQTADLEPVPGVPPTISHLQTLLDRGRQDPPVAIIQTLYQNPQAGRWLSEKLAVPALQLPSTVTAEGASSELTGLFDDLIKRLLGVIPRRSER